ncbi:MAG: nickel pincer cofactor biosynthesis protein LarB [Phycisphaeraceae bacterium]|nr:nickel pincer cofactor biosynthesis protein LarB [Phycisphaeraceae bacterium]
MAKRPTPLPTSPPSPHEAALRAPAESFTQENILALLHQVAAGQISAADALQALRHLPFESLDFATLDHHRQWRKGFPEVVYCAGKTTAQVRDIIARLAELNPRVLGTRATIEQYQAARQAVPDLQYHALANALYLDRQPDRPRLDGVVVVAAGTSDLPVAEEAVLTLDLLGHAATKIIDVGVAGLHRLLAHLPALEQANVIVAVAGMEGALPSVVAGLVAGPVIAVPTSVGYGASFQGVTALLAMLNSCAAGIGVVNIDNGFGAGFLAATINRRIHQARGPTE